MKAKLVPDIETMERRSGASLNVCRPGAGRLVLFSGHALLLADDDGTFSAPDAGLYFHHTRFLSGLDFRVAGKAPTPASNNPVSTDRAIGYVLAPIPDARAERGEITKRGVEVRVETTLHEGLRLALTLTNHALDPCLLPLEWRLGADFAEQSAERPGDDDSAAGARASWDGHALLLTSEHPRLRHATRIAFDGPAPFAADGAAVSCRLPLAPRQSAAITVTVSPVFDPAFAGELEVRGPVDRDGWLAGCAKLETDAVTVRSAWRRAVDDILGLQLGDGRGEETFTPAAGAPKYIGLFGRDAVMTGLQTLMLNPSTLRGALSLVGRWTATRRDDAYDAQPGRVLHQRQLGPWALLGKTPYRHYYGDHSASGLFLLGLASAFAQSGDAGRFGSMKDQALRVLAWMDRDGDLDGDGIYEYQTFAPRGGLKNQGWKDSDEAILYPDGTIAPDPLAVCEIQALFFAAKRALGLAFRWAGDDALADRLLDEAQALRERFEAGFWMEAEGFYALALDPAKNQVRTIASNPGACLAYGIADQSRARRVADRLMRPDLFSGWGVRTLSSDHPAYNPLAYHLGSVWPSSNALAARGFARYGLDEHLHALAGAMIESSTLFEFGRMPELFGGHGRDESPHPGLYPGACSPQAWSAGAVISLVFSLAGLAPAVPAGELVVDPKLPPWLPELTLEQAPVGRGCVSLTLRREPDGGAEVEVTHNSSGVRIVRPWEADPAALQLAKAVF